MSREGLVNGKPQEPVGLNASEYEWSLVSLAPSQ